MKVDLASNNLLRLIWHKTQTRKPKNYKITKVLLSYVYGSYKLICKNLNNYVWPRYKKIEFTARIQENNLVLKMYHAYYEK